jgi:hypothetical protein
LAGKKGVGMETLALTIITIGIGMWFVTKKAVAVFVIGVGVGLLWGALWAAATLRAAFS